MGAYSTETEELIKATAKKVFFVDGNVHANTQDIADAAGINRASIHYYYRTRKQLFDTVFKEAMGEMKERLSTFFEEKLTFREKISQFIDLFFEKSEKNPFLEIFIITELNVNKEMTLPFIKQANEKRDMNELQRQINIEVEAGTMKAITWQHFIATLVSLCSFPYMAKPILNSGLAFSEEDYKTFLSERKQVILKLIFLDV